MIEDPQEVALQRMRRRSFSEQLRDRIDIVELIGATVHLQPVARHTSGTCPLCNAPHAFNVFPETRHFKCFGCGKGGDVFTFLMEKDGLTFAESLARLAAKAGVEVPS